MSQNTQSRNHLGLSRLNRPRATWAAGLLLIVAFTSFGMIASGNLPDGPSASHLSLVDTATRAGEWLFSDSEIGAR